PARAGRHGLPAAQPGRDRHQAPGLGAQPGSACRGDAHSLRAASLFPQSQSHLRGKAMTTKFTPDHEYIRVEGSTGIVGVTPYAQEALGDIVFVELPSVGKVLKKGDEAAVVESVKAASEI